MSHAHRTIRYAEGETRRGIIIKLTNDYSYFVSFFFYKQSRHKRTSTVLTTSFVIGLHQTKASNNTTVSADWNALKTRIVSFKIQYNSIKIKNVQNKFFNFINNQHIKYGIHFVFEKQWFRDGKQIFIYNNEII